MKRSFETTGVLNGRTPDEAEAYGKTGLERLSA